MSNRKIIRLLLLCNLLLLVIHVFLSFKGMGNVLLSRTTLMTPLDKSQTVERIAIARKGEAVTVLESALSLATTNAVASARPGDWLITHPYAAAAESRLARSVQDALTLSPVLQVYREQDLLDFGCTRADYGLEDPSVVVTVTVGEESHTFSFGSVTKPGDGVFVTVAGDPEIYVVGTNVLAAVDRAADGFRLRDLCPDGVEASDGFRIKRGAASLQSFRLRDGTWYKSSGEDDSASEPASAFNVRELFRRIGQARVADFVWPVGAPDEPTLATAPLLAGYGLDPDSATTVTLLRSGTSEQRQITFGKPATNGLVYALVQDNRAIVRVDGELCDFIRTTDFSDHRLFPFEESAVSRFSVGDNGVNYRLTRGAEGLWRIDEPVSAPADPTSVRKLLRRILEMSVANRAESGLVVSVLTNAPSETVSADSLLSDLSLADLRSREILRIDPSDVRRLMQTGGVERASAVLYDKDLRCWTVESAPTASAAVAETAVSAALAALDPLVAEKVVLLKVGPSDLHRYGLEESEARCRICIDPKEEGQLRRIVLIGRKAQGGSFATLVGASESVFILSDETVRKLTAPLVTE